MNERRTIKVIIGWQDRLPSEFSSSPTPSPLLAEPDFQFSSGLQPHSDKHQHDHDTSATTPILSSNDHDLTTSSLSTPVRPTHRRLLHIPHHSFSTENTLLVCLFNARSVGTSRRRSNTSTFILDNNIDIMLLTEIWLRPAGDEAKITDLALPGYSQSSPSPALRADPASKARPLPSS